MNIATRIPAMTQDAFLEWVQTQDGRFEFDGLQPVAMTGGTSNHSRAIVNLHVALRARLRGGPCIVLGPDAGLATSDSAVRYPDVMVSCAEHPGTSLLIPGVVIVFEVISPSSDRNDRSVKLREYRSVPTIRRYVIMETAYAGLTVFARQTADADWTAAALAPNEVLDLPEIGASIRVAELYEDLGLT